MRLSVMTAGRSRAAISASILFTWCHPAKTHDTNLSQYLTALPAVDLCRLHRYGLFEPQQHIG